MRQQHNSVGENTDGAAEGEGGKQIGGAFPFVGQQKTGAPEKDV